MKKLNIAIVGLGNIGSYLFKYLNDNKKILTEKNNCLPIVKYVSAKNKKRKRNIFNNSGGRKKLRTNIQGHPMDDAKKCKSL